MRRLLDMLMAVMAAALLAGVMWHARTETMDRSTWDAARTDLRRLQREVLLRATLDDVELSSRGYPMTIDPSWFGASPPENVLTGRSRPWLEIAGPDQRELDHPLELTTLGQDAAAFWYNPYRGIVRARVPAGTTDAAALEVYNYVNDCALPSLFVSEDKRP